jgi:hypothetical protein
MSSRLILALLSVTLIGGLIWYQEAKPVKKAERIFDDRVRYSTKSFRPFDTKFAYDAIKKHSRKGFKINSKAVTDSTNALMKGTGKVMVVMSPYFLPTQKEVNKLLDFVEAGNNLYVSSFTIASPFLNSIIGRDSTDAEFELIENFPPKKVNGKTEIYFKANDSLGRKIYTYPGDRFLNTHGSFRDEKYDKINLASEVEGDAAIIKIQFGDGAVFINFCPVSMSNYFLLHKQNYQFLNEIYNQIGAKDKTIIWDTFYEKHKIQRPEPLEDTKAGDSYFWKVIDQYPTLGWAIFTFFMAIGLFVLVYARRIQKPVTVIAEPENNSVEFVKAVSGLYWLRQDHKKIAEKLAHQFNDYLAVNYRIPYQEITLEKAEKIAQKTGKNQADIEAILSLINEIELADKIKPKALSSLYTKVYSIVNQ